MVPLLVLLVWGTLCSQGRIVWLDPPVSVADDRAIRLDVQTATILLRAKVTQLVACSAVDMPLVAYDGAHPETTGCGTPGFKATQIFPETGSLDVFHVRQRARSMFIKRRLLDLHSPTVWLQATLEVRDEHGRLVEGIDSVQMARFQVPERVLPIGATLPPVAPVESLTDSVLKFLHLRSGTEGQDLDEALRDYDELDGREETNNGTSTRYLNHVHWSNYTAVIFGGLFAVVLIVVALLRWSRSGRRLGRSRRPKDHLSDDDLESGRAERIRKWTAHAEASGLYHSEAY